MPHWTITRMGPVDTKTAVVTGANSGLGYQTTRQLAAHGAHVIMACRDAERGKQPLERLRKDVPEAGAEVRPLDLASLAAVQEFADGLAGPVHILVNNAGVMALPKRTTADGFEMQFGGQFFGPDGPLGARGKAAKPVGRSNRALDENAASRLWEVSERLTGVTYGQLAPKQ